MADHISEAKQMKIEQVAVIKEKLEKAQSVVLVEYKGITVAQDTKLRAQCRANNVEYKVLKNRLVKKALEQLGIEGFDKALEETTAFAFGYDDCVTPAKVIADNAKEIKCLNIKCGLVEGAFADKATIEKLATIPPKEVLIAQFLGLLQSPMSGFARVLAAIAEKQEA